MIVPSTPSVTAPEPSTPRTSPWLVRTWCPTARACRTWMVVCIGSLPGWRNSRYLRAARSISVDSAASSVMSHWFTSRLTTAGGSDPPRSCVGGPGCGSRGRVITMKIPSRTNQPAAAVPATTTSNTRPSVMAVPPFGSEPDLDVLAFAADGLEVLLGTEPAHAGDDVRRDRLDGGVQRLHGAVEE